MADNGFEGLKVLRWVTVKFDVADVATVGEGMIGGFYLDLVEGGDAVVDTWKPLV